MQRSAQDDLFDYVTCHCFVSKFHRIAIQFIAAVKNNAIFLITLLIVTQNFRSMTYLYFLSEIA